MKTISAVIFDVDGLMLDTEAVGLIIWTKACADFGYTMTKDIFMEMVGRNTTDANNVCFRAFGGDFPADKIRAKKVDYGRQYIAEHGLAPKKGLLDLLALLRQRKVLIGVATSTDKPLAFDRLAAGGLLPSQFDAITCGDEVAKGKPAPDIFLETARRLDVAAESCLVFEDSEAGLQGAFSAGMYAVMVPDLKPPSAAAREIAYCILPSLVEARKFVIELTEDPAE